MTPPIRVAHVMGSTGVYGAERGVLALLRHVPQSRVDATLVNLVDRRGQQSEVVRRAKERGLAALDLYTGGRFSPAGITRLADLVRRNRIQILHSHGYKPDALALVAARLTGTRVISTPHGFSREGGRVLAAYEAIDRVLLRFMDHVCPLSPELRIWTAESEGVSRGLARDGSGGKLLLGPSALRPDQADLT